jgi:hypothetical protein
MNWNWCENATFDENDLSIYLAKPFEMIKWYLKQECCCHGHSPHPIGWVHDAHWQALNSSS